MMKHGPDLVSVVTRRCERFTAVMGDADVVNLDGESIGGSVHWIPNLILETIMEWLHMARQTACMMHDDTAAMTIFRQKVSGEPAGWLLSCRVRTSVSWPKLNFRPISGWVSNDLSALKPNGGLAPKWEWAEIWTYLEALIWTLAHLWAMLMSPGLLGFQIWDPEGFVPTRYEYFGNWTIELSGVVLKDDSGYYAEHEMLNKWTTRHLPP